MAALAMTASLAPGSASGLAWAEQTHGEAHAPTDPQTSAQTQGQTQGQAEVAAAQILEWTTANAFTYTTAPTTAVAGTTTIVYESSAATGNTSGTTHNLTFDTSTPGYNHDAVVNITASPFDDQGGRHQVDVNLTPGKYRYFCSLPGHEINGMFGEFVVTEVGGADTTAPVVSAQVSGEQDADGSYVGAATVAIAAQDAESSVESVEYALDGAGFGVYTDPVVVNAPGVHTLVYRATDGAGNVSADGTVSFTVVEPAPGDTTAPVVSAQVSGDQDADGSYVGAATVAIAAQDAESSVESVEYALDGAGFGVYTDPVVVNAPGVHTLVYRATDGAGNVSADGTVSFTVVEPAPGDTTAPVVSAQVSGEQDADSSYIGSATVAISAQDADSGVASVEYALDGVAFGPYTEPVTVDQAGDHLIAYRATDGAGNVSPEGTVSFTVVEPAPGDTTAPVVSAQVSGQQDADGSYIGSATVAISAQDADSGVAGVEYALDGAGFGAYTDPVTVEQAGDHVIAYRATDSSGNVSAEGSVSFRVVEPAPGDTTAPVVSAQVSGEQDADGSYIGAATVAISAQDADSGVAGVEYALDGAGFGAYTDPVTVNELGEHTLRYRATDSSGNVSPEGTVSFMVLAAQSDACPGSDARDTVVIGDHDSTVVNVDTGDGCTINDLIDEDAEYANHGRFVKHVAQVTNALVADAVISQNERSHIMKVAARSDVGK